MVPPSFSLLRIRCDTTAAALPGRRRSSHSLTFLHPPVPLVRVATLAPYPLDGRCGRRCQGIRRRIRRRHRPGRSGPPVRHRQGVFLSLISLFPLFPSYASFPANFCRALCQPPACFLRCLSPTGYSSCLMKCLQGFIHQIGIQPWRYRFSPPPMG